MGILEGMERPEVRLEEKYRVIEGERLKSGQNREFGWKRK